MFFSTWSGVEMAWLISHKFRSVVFSSAVEQISPPLQAHDMPCAA